MSATKKPAARKPSTRKPAARRPARLDLRTIDPLTAPYWGIEAFEHARPEVAIRVTAILSCVRFIAASLASMPVRVIRTLPNGRKEVASELPVYRVLARRPNSWQSAYELWEMVAHHTALYGNSYLKIESGPSGRFCESLTPLHPSRMTVSRMSDGSLSYRYLQERARHVEYAQEEIVHFRWMSDNGYTGMVPAELCATSISLARKLDAAANSYWENMARPDVVIETSQQVSEEAGRNFLRQWNQTFAGARKRGQAAILPAKAQIKTIAGDSQEASGFQELRAALVTECARAFGIPSTLIGDPSMARYSNVEQEFLTAQVFCLLSWQRRIESALDRSILSFFGDEYTAKLDSRGLLRADTSSRVALYGALWNQGAITPNEVRDLEDLPLLEDPAADQTFVQLGFSTLAAAAAQAGQQPAAADPAAPAAPAPDPAAPPPPAGTTIADTSLNGAQVSSLLEVIAAVGSGTLDASSAVAVIVAAFPQIDEAQAGKMVAGASAPATVAAPAPAPAPGA